MNKKERRGWPMPHRAWAKFEVCSTFFHTSHIYFVYTLCTILPCDFCIDHYNYLSMDIGIQFKRNLHCCYVIKSNSDTISCFPETSPWIAKSLIFDHLHYLSYSNIFNTTKHPCISQRPSYLIKLIPIRN